MGEQLVSNCWRSCMRTLYAPTHTEGKRETATGFVSYEATPIHETDRRANGFEYVARERVRIRGARDASFYWIRDIRFHQFHEVDIE